jgi:hypothetical protein
MRAKYTVFGVVLGVLLSSAAIVLAGNLDPPSGPTDATSQMHTLEQIYQRLDTGAAGTKMTGFTEPLAGPGSTMHTLDDIMAIAPAADDADGATTADVASGRTFWGLTAGEWGVQTGTAAAGAALPCFDDWNRYVDCGNGTVHDTVTGLIWLKEADCLGKLPYAAANNVAVRLQDGECGLTDGSSPGDWRLPTKEEWEATVAEAVAQHCVNGDGPALTNKKGDDCFSQGPDEQFTGVQTDVYRSSSTDADLATRAWVAPLNNGIVGVASKTNLYYAWPVRGGQ